MRVSAAPKASRLRVTTREYVQTGDVGREAMIHSALEFLVEAVIAVWPFGDKRWWKLSLFLCLALVAAVVIGVTLAE